MTAAAGSQRVMLGVSGAIAAYKAADVLRGLRRAGLDVTVALTRNASQFVTPFLLGNLAGRPAIVDQYAPELADVHHIPLAEVCDLLLLAPATADLIGKLAGGLADDFITTFYLASPAPLLLAPAMNWRMWEHPTVQANVARLRALGAQTVGPVHGDLATFHRGLGRMADPADVVAAALRVLGGSPLKGVSLLVTAGPTEEALDPVRVLSNRSSGRMGFALAHEAWLRGADVTLVAGPTELEPPRGPELVRVRSAADMRAAVLARAGGARVVVMCAAVSDFTPAEPSAVKLKKDGRQALTLELVRTPDILAELGALGGDRLLVGFAAEDRDVEVRATAKLVAKGAHLIVANDISRADIGLGAVDNEVLILDRDGNKTVLEKAPKERIAAGVLDVIQAALRRRR